MKIVTLIENLVYKRDLVAEHGLSFYIETENKKILFDTGQSAAFMQNAKLLGIDISSIDIVIISHGHFDHTGGIEPFLKENTKAKIHIKKEALTPKYHGTERFIGMPGNISLYSDRINYVTDLTEIDNKVFIVSDIPIINKDDTNFVPFKIKGQNGFENDEFSDELFLALQHKDELSIITSCSHRGITNIVHATINNFNLPVNFIIGGFHIKDCGKTQYESIVNYLKEIKPKSIGVCHCTGVERYADIRNECKAHVFYNYTGSIIEV